ncbi:MAG: polysaccharide deacetylase family protein [Planctomycetes bacterium]|nr:polysaccharide deacetylase family protein [Planctomycetota bacterium]
MTPLAILTYHSLDDSGSVVSVSPGAFAAQMGAVAECGFRGVTLSEAVEHRLAHGDWPAQRLVITFDDGFANTHEVALPVLARRGFAATVFLITGHVGGRNDWSAPPPGLGTRPMMTWAQVAELAQKGIEIGGHSHTHPDMRRISDAQVEHELAICKAEIHEQLGYEARTFAYPYGSRSERVAEAAGRQFAAACTAVLKRVQAEPLAQLPRVDAYYLRTPKDVVRLLTGRWDSYLTLRRLGRRVRRMFA